MTIKPTPIQLLILLAFLLGLSPLSERQGSAGTPQKLTARNGNTTWAARYSAFGAATVNIEGVSNPLRLAGQYYDAESYPGGLRLHFAHQTNSQPNPHV